MTKTLSVGIINSSEINYITFNIHCVDDIKLFCSDLACYIINKYTNCFFRMIINRNYGTLSKNEKSEIYKIAENSFSNTYSGEAVHLKRYIQQKLYNYFVYEKADSIVLEGFVRFRLKSFYEELEMIIDYSVDDYFMQREYESFILMLKEFITLQKPLIKTVHIKIENDGRYVMCDENFEELSKSRILELEGLFDKESFFCEDDLLLSALISVAPRKIVIHCVYNMKNKQLLETIEAVFENRIFNCEGCIFCK